MQTQSRIPFTLDDYFALVVEAKTHTLESRRSTSIKLLSTMAYGQQPLVGQEENNESIFRWNADGTYVTQQHPLDLFMVEKKPKSLGFVNVYQTFSGTATRELADRNAKDAAANGHTRVACIEVFEGQGLDESTNK